DRAEPTELVAVVAAREFDEQSDDTRADHREPGDREGDDARLWAPSPVRANLSRAEVVVCAKTVDTFWLGKVSQPRESSFARGEAEPVDRRVDLHGREGGLVYGPGDRDCVVPRRQTFVEEDEGIALRVRRHDRGLPPDGHLDRGRTGKTHVDRSVA